MTANNLKSTIYVSLILLLGLTGKSQQTLFEDSKHVIHYELTNDSICITAEDLSDFTLDLTPTTDSSKLDFVLFMFDLNQSGNIEGGSNNDIYYTYNDAGVPKTCRGDILSNNNLGACLGTTSSLSASLEKSLSSITPHVIYKLYLPISDLHTAQQVCARLSVKIHRSGDTKNTFSNFPSGSNELYDVANYYPINLFENVNLGDEEIQFCKGDSISANASYPSYEWSDGSNNNFMTPKTSGEVSLTVADNTCQLKDTVDVVIQDEVYCTALSLSFPNIVTPNNNGYNDFFEPLASAKLNAMDFTGAELTIYNRWGVQVGGKSGQAPFWDCFLDWGQKAPSGTYYYVFKPGSSGGKVVNGYFTVIYTEK